MIEIIHPGSNAIGVALPISFSETEKFINFATPKLENFKSLVRWHYQNVDGDRVCCTAYVIKPLQAQFLNILTNIANEYSRNL